MSNKETTDTTKVEEEVDAEATETEEVEETETVKEDAEAKDIDNEADYDAELEKENKGKPDPEKAKEAFAKRKAEREDGDEEGKPLTKKELEALLASDRKAREQDNALQLARSLAGSDKEAQVILAKWGNRTFPSHLTLREQIEESYAITHSKKIIGERNEALRALKGKNGVSNNSAGTHQDSKKKGEPDIAGGDKAAILASGFAWNGTSRRFEKKLKNGDILVRDPKTKQTVLLKKS